MSSEMTPSRQIADDLRGQVTRGELEAGDRLPTQRQLAEQYSVARMTVVRALEILEHEGLVTSIPTKGTVVRKPSYMPFRPQAEYEKRTSASLDRFMSEFSAAGSVPTQSIAVEVVIPPKHVAVRLGLDEGDLAAVRRRVRSLDGVAVNINDTFYPYSLVSDTEIMSPSDIPRGSNNVLRDKGLPEAYARDEIFIRMPDSDDRHRLGLGPGTPVAVQYTTGYTSDELAIRCDVFVLPGDRNVILYERQNSDEIQDFFPSDS